MGLSQGRPWRAACIRMASNTSNALDNFRSRSGTLALWSGCPPNSTETQKELKWPKSDSKVTSGVPAQSDTKWPKSDSKVTQKESLLSHFWVTFGSLWGRSARVTFESLLGHFNSFCVSVELGGRPLHNPCPSSRKRPQRDQAFLENHCRGWRPWNSRRRAF